MTSSGRKRPRDRAGAKSRESDVCRRTTASAKGGRPTVLIAGGNQRQTEKIPVASRPRRLHLASPTVERPTDEGSTMLHPAVIAFLALCLATILDLRAADATAISPLDLSSLQFCAGCERPKNDYLQMSFDWSISAQTTTVDIDANEGQTTFDFPNLTESPISEEAQLLIGNFSTAMPIKNQLELYSKYLVNDQDDYSGSNRCAYFDSRLHDPKRVQDKCGYIEPGSDYSELISVLTLSIVSALSFALIALAWLLHRAYRSWRLRKMISQGATIPNRYDRKGRRRVGGSISA